MSFLRNADRKSDGKMRIIGAISIDLNGISNENAPETIDVKAQSQLARTIFEELCSNSTIHGIRYIAERKRHWIERIWWVVAFTLSVALCTLAILSIWWKWQHRPVLMSFNDKTTSIGTIPFPAVTICSTKKFTKDNVNVAKFMDVLNSVEINQTTISALSSDEINHLDTIVHICSKEIMNLEDGVVIPRTASIYGTIEEISPDMNSVIVFATWVGQFTQFHPIFTGEGLCFTFNSLNSNEIYTNEITPQLLTVINNPTSTTKWNMENGYASTASAAIVYPHRVFGCGLRNSLQVMLGIYIDDSDEFCNLFAQGFHISLHTPDQLASLPDEFIYVPVEQDIYITIKPTVITISKGLRRYPPDQRGCFLQKERKLRFFKSYTQQNCERECSANFTKAACGCVRFSMPRDNITKVCAMTDIECYVNADSNFTRNLIMKECGCLPDCTTISYDVEVSQAPSQYSAADMEFKSSFNQSGFETMSKLFISFKENNFIGLNRAESYTTADFVASCGGLLGLFMGVSMLSFVELIYFFSLRLCCNLRKRKLSQTTTSVWARRTHFAPYRPHQSYFERA